MKRIFNRWFFVSLFLASFSAHAFLPVLIGAVAREAVAITAENITLGIIAKGFAANDPYVRTTATMPRKVFAGRLAALRVARWSGVGKLAVAIGLALGLDVLYDEANGFYERIPYDPDVRGNCKFGWGSTGVTFRSCLQQYIDYANTVNSPSNYRFDHITSADGIFFYFVKYPSGDIVTIFNTTDPSGSETKRPLTESEINRSLVGVSSNVDTWGDYLAGLDQPSLNALLDGATIPDYNPFNPTPEIAQLKDWYRQGLLQTTNPNAAYYVTPEQLAEIKKAIDAENAANTDDGVVDALNQKLKQPITQAQYEESNLKTVSQQATAFSTAIATATTPLDKVQQERQDIINNISNPAAPPSSLDFFNWSIPTGHCTGFNIDMSVDGGRLHKTKLVDSHCPFYNDIGHPAIFWFLNIVTFLFVWRLWDQSISDMAR